MKSKERFEDMVEVGTYRPDEDKTIHQPLYSHITIQDSVEAMIISYKGKEYRFDLEKALKLLCKEVRENE